MSYNTENAMRHAPGLIFGCLDNGDMILDRNSGEFLPAEQVLKDPLHREQLDCLDEGGFGSLKLGSLDMDADSDDESPADDDSDDDGPVGKFLSDQEELTHLIAAQSADRALDDRYLVDVNEDAVPATTCTKRRHRELGTDKTDGGARYKLLPHHGRNTQYKNRRRQPSIW